MSANYRDAIMDAARKAVQAHGYAGLNMRTLADSVGIKSASIYYHFPGKAALAAAVARRYWEDSLAELHALEETEKDAAACLARYPATFRRALENDNRMCLCSYMAAEYDDLPDEVQAEVQRFAEVNVEWLGKMLVAAGVVGIEDSGGRARAIHAAVVGAQLMARSRADISLYDALIDDYRRAGLLPA